VKPEKVAPVHAIFLEKYWFGADGLSAVNAIGRQSRDVIISGSPQWLFVV
jgi:hypothetical protein